MLRRCTVALTILALCGVSAAKTPERMAVRDLPERYMIRSLDGPPATVDSPVDGRAWAAWSYRSRGEYDIATSEREPNGTWSSPRFLGGNDGVDQVDPALAIDPWGNLYLAWAERETGRIALAVLPSGSEAWSDPMIVGPSLERASSPALRVVETRLVLAFRVEGSGIAILDLPLYCPHASMQGIQDGPDILPPANNNRKDGPGGFDPGGGNGKK